MLLSSSVPPLTQGNDVVGHGSGTHDALGLALATQWFGSEATLALLNASLTTKALDHRDLQIQLEPHPVGHGSNHWCVHRT